MTVEIKPWGSYVILQQESGYQVKRVEVRPGQRLSLQKHAHRAETWIVVSGVGTATLGSRPLSVKAGSVVEIPVQEVHRMHNTGKQPLIFIEVQFGDYLGEDDIVRLEDDFDRAKKS